MAITKADFSDLDIVDSYELASDGYSIYLSTTLISTNNIGNIITINYPSDGEGLITGRDHLVQSGDRVQLLGTSGNLADGYFTINLIINETSFSIVESIASSTGGLINFMYVSGASNVGFNLLAYTPFRVAHFNVQQAIQDLDKPYHIKQIEIDFGTLLTNYKTFIILDPEVTVNSRLFITQAGNAPTNRSWDENEMDPIIFSANPQNGQFILIASSKDGPVVGKYKVNYGIGLEEF
jgi:hypothetical protein